MKSGISVVIPSRPYEPHLNQCLKTLIDQKFSNFEVIVVFNPDQKMVLPDLGTQLKISTSAKGVNCARNKGISLSRYDLILFIDADCVIRDPFFLNKYFEIMESNLQLTGVGGPYFLPPNSNPITQAYHFIQSDWITRALNGPDFSTRCLLGGNMMLRRSMIKDIRFEESLIFGGTETELLCRLTSVGHKLLFVPEQGVEHCSELTLDSLKYKAKMQGMGRRSIIDNRKVIKRGIGLPRPSSEISRYVGTYHKEFHRAYNSISKSKQLLLLMKKTRVQLLYWIDIFRLKVLK